MPNSLKEYSGDPFTEDERRELRRELEGRRRVGWLINGARNVMTYVVGAVAASAALMQILSWLRGNGQ